MEVWKTKEASTSFQALDHCKVSQENITEKTGKIHKVYRDQLYKMKMVFQLAPMSTLSDTHVSCIATLTLQNITSATCNKQIRQHKLKIRAART